MENQLLRDPLVQPNDEVLERTLAASQAAYCKLLGYYSEPVYSLVPQWRYYKDGKAWLCKVVHKKKTVFWLSVWDGYFKASFFFRERDCKGVLELGIDPLLKQQLRESKPFGLLFPLVLSIYTEEQLSDLCRIITYKKSLK